MNNYDSFFDYIDHKKKSQIPESICEFYENNLEANCPVCNLQFRVHTTKNLVLCALHEIRDDFELKN